MRAVVLRRLSRQVDLPFAFINFGPYEVANLRFALAAQDQQPNDATIVIVFTCAPNLNELSFSQNPVAGAALRSRANIEGWIVLTMASLDGSTVEAAQRRARPICGNLASIGGDIVDNADDGLSCGDLDGIAVEGFHDPLELPLHLCVIAWPHLRLTLNEISPRQFIDGEYSPRWAIKPTRTVGCAVKRSCSGERTQLPVLPMKPMSCAVETPLRAVRGHAALRQ